MNDKSKGFNLAWVLLIVAITSIISALTTGVIIYNNNKINNKLTYADLSSDENINQFLEIYANITNEYYEDVDKKELVEKAIAGMMNYLDDDYSTYLNNDESHDLVEQLVGEYKGIGVSINNSDKSISKVYSDTPASKAGVLAGDVIIGFNNTDVTNKTANEIVEMIKKSNSDFTLKLKRGNEVVNVTLKNETILAPNIDYKIVDNTNIGYIKIETFSKTLNEQIKKSLKELESQNMSSLIIDLRDNTGGYLKSAEEVASQFLAKDKVIYSLDYKGDVTSYRDETDEHRNYKIVILTNKQTASASEILAAALKDSYGAVLVGETTFGKGKVQQVVDLKDGSMVKYTSAYWRTPKNICIDKVGITPDYQVLNEAAKDANGNLMITKDNQLEKAISLLK